MKLRAEIEIPDDADYLTIEDAKLSAEWKEIYSQTDRMNRTCLEGKCGSCKYFISRKYGNCLSYGDCTNGRKNYRARSNPACSDYERRKK